VQPTSVYRRSSLAGTVALVTDIDTPLGAAIARRLAAETATLAIGGKGPRVAEALAEVERVRVLHRIGGPPLAVSADPSTEDGAREIVDLALSTHGRLDSLVHAVRPAHGPPSTALDPLLAMLRMAASAMHKQPSGRVLLALDLCGEEQLRRFAAARARLTAAFEALVQFVAYTHFSSEICVNGLIIEGGPAGANGKMALSGLSASRTDVGPSPTANAYVAACSVVSLLASGSGAGITGQIFRVGGSPTCPSPGSEIAGFLHTSLRLS